MTQKYPVRLLPLHSYHKIKDSDITQNMYFIRQIRRGYQIKHIRNLRSKCKKLLSASEFYGGISCNLLSIFKKSDAALLPSNDDQLGYTEYWNEGAAARFPTEGNYECYPWQGYFGFMVKDVYKFEAEIPIKNSKGKTIRKDTALLRFVHAPTYCNFWHFNLFLHAKHAVTGQIYNLSGAESDVSKTQVGRIAASLIDDIALLLRTGKSLKYTYVTKSKYK